MNNLNAGAVWGPFPLLFAAAGMTLAQIGTLAAHYLAVWSGTQLAAAAVWLVAALTWLSGAAAALRRGQTRARPRA